READSVRGPCNRRNVSVRLLEHAQTRAAGRIPKADGLVHSSRSERFAIRAPGHRPHRRGVAPERLDLVAVDVPQVNRAIGGPKGQPLAIWRPGHDLLKGITQYEGPQEPPGHGVPDPCGRVRAPRGHVTSVRTPGDG